MFGVSALQVASGGNLDFMTSVGALSATLRLTFGYYDYSDFISNYQGLGAFGVNTDIWYVTIVEALGKPCVIIRREYVLKIGRHHLHTHSLLTP